MDTLPFIDDLLPALRACAGGRYAIALAGAHAKGHWDSGSDLDLFLLVDELKPVEARRAGLETLGAENFYITEDLDAHPWGGSIDFTLRGKPIEVTVRSIGRMQTVVAACAAGQFTVLPVLWTIHGYYDFTYLAEASFLKPLDDPWEIIPGLRANIDPYPAAFRKAAVDFFWPRANAWMNNFHYHSAIGRADFVYTSGILQQSFHNLAQVLFPLNRRFFQGDKRLAAQLADLPFCPGPLLHRLDFLLSALPDPAAMEEQRALFLQSLDETAAQLAKENLI